MAYYPRIPVSKLDTELRERYKEVLDKYLRYIRDPNWDVYVHIVSGDTITLSSGYWSDTCYYDTKPILNVVEVETKKSRYKDTMWDHTYKKVDRAEYGAVEEVVRWDFNEIHIYILEGSK
ncbi:hypothetical protein [Pyrococcus kukulkanii]|uniref:hypothetical protein n=1 Tax=Pyrococcus kukulkanii TaxID=1609559 RepID=UPI00356AFF48